MAAFSHNTSPKYTTMAKKSIPCYIPNGGEHFVINIPFGFFQRVQLKRLVNELLERGQVLGTFVAAEASAQNLRLLKGLARILDIDLKPIERRREAEALLAANEENLKQFLGRPANLEDVNLVSLSVSCGLIVALFLLAAHLEYLQNASF